MPTEDDQWTNTNLPTKLFLLIHEKPMVLSWNFKIAVENGPAIDDKTYVGINDLLFLTLVMFLFDELKKPFLVLWGGPPVKRKNNHVL